MSEIAPWLETELSRQLGPVSAPESLWDRIEAQQGRPPVRSAHWPLWPIAAVVMLTVAGSVFWRAAAPTMQDLALRELRGSDALDFHSDDPVEIRNWVKAKADIDIALPATRPGVGAIRLLGARLVEYQGEPVAAVSYRVGNGSAMLLVSRRQPADGGDVANRAHRFAPIRAGNGARLFAWNMRRQEYMIACSDMADPQVACLLCHTSPQTTLN